MSVKKLVCATVAGAALALAGSAIASGAGAYGHLNLGYGLQDFNGSQLGASSESSGARMTKGGKGGYAYGADLGYRFNKNLAAEIGGFMLPRAKWLEANTVKVRSWMGYAAAKLIIPSVAKDFDLYMKAGAAYRRFSFKGYAHNAEKKGSWRPSFAFGVEYNYDSNWLFNLQYTHVASTEVKLNNIGKQMPSVHLVTFGAGYAFAM